MQAVDTIVFLVWVSHRFDRDEGLGAEGALRRLIRLAILVMLVRIQHVVPVCRRKLVHGVRRHVVDADGVHRVAHGRQPCAWSCATGGFTLSSCRC